MAYLFSRASHRRVGGVARAIIKRSRCGNLEVTLNEHTAYTRRWLPLRAVCTYVLVPGISVHQIVPKIQAGNTGKSQVAKQYLRLRN